MRILLLTEPVTPRPLTAGARYALELARGWAHDDELERTHQLVVLSTPEDAPHLGCAHVETPYSTATWDWRRKLQLLRALPRLLSDVDVVQTFNTPRPLTDWLLARACARSLRVRRLVRVAPNLRGWMGAKHAPVGDIVVASSTWTHAQLVTSGERFTKLMHITPGISSEVQVRTTQARETSSPFMCVYPGDYQDVGNAAHLVRAVERCRERGLDVQVTLAGRARDRREERARARVRETVHRLSASSFITLSSTAADEFALMMTGADVVIFPVTTLTRKFDLPFSVLDAMAAGIPIIASDYGPLGELASRGGCVLAPPGDAGALADALEQLATDPVHHATVIADGRASVREYFSSTLMAAQYRALYDELAH